MRLHQAQLRRIKGQYAPWQCLHAKNSVVTLFALIRAAGGASADNRRPLNYTRCDMLTLISVLATATLIKQSPAFYFSLIFPYMELYAMRAALQFTISSGARRARHAA